MSGGRPDALVVLQAAAGGGARVDEFKYYGDTGYNCMGRYDLYGGFTVPALACFGTVHGKMSTKSAYPGAVFECRIWWFI